MRDENCKDIDTCRGNCENCSITSRHSLAAEEPHNIPRTFCPDIDQQCGRFGFCNTANCPIKKN